MQALMKRALTIALGMAVFGTVVSAEEQVVINDPLAYWSFEDVDNALSNQVISSPYHDATVIKGAPTFGLIEDAQGIVGNALVLDGASGIRLPYHQDNLGTSFTISLWYWQETNDTRQCVFQTRDNYTASYEAWAADSQFHSYVGQQHAGAIVTRLQEWVHLAHVFSTVTNITTLSVYTNGVLELTGSDDADNMFNVLRARGLHVGVTRIVSLNGGRCFKGMIDEMALWGRALSSNEVAAVYQRGADGSELEFTPRVPPTISLANNLRSYVVQADAGIPDNILYNGWLRAGGTDETGNVPDSARAAQDAIGSTMPDTAGHTDGPFNAEKIADMRWRVPMTSGLALKQLPQGDYTLETWFRTKSLVQNILVGTHPGGTGGGVINLELDGSNRVKLYMKKNTSATAERVEPTIDPNRRDGNWHHLAGVKDDTTAYLYMDGVEIGKTENLTVGSYDLGEDYLYIGQDGRQTRGLFNGEIGEIGNVRVWERALSTNEVKSMTAFGIPGANGIASDGLVAEYESYRPFHASPDGEGWRVVMTPKLKQIPQTNYTYEVVFRTTDTDRCILLGNYSGSGYDIINFELTNDKRFRLVTGSAGVQIIAYASEGDSGIRDGAWHRAAAVNRDGKLYLYMDGEQRGTPISATTGSYALKGDYLGIGKDFRAPPIYPLNGDIASASIWSRALSVDELAGLTASNEVPLAGLAAHYVFPTNTLHTAGFPGSSFFRTFDSGDNAATLSFVDLPNHNKIGLGLLLAQLDLLDPIGEDDHFAIKIDGTEVLRVGLGSGQDNNPQVDSLSLFGTPADVQLFKDTLVIGGEELFGCGNDDVLHDHVYDLSQLEALQFIPHSSGTLTLEISGIQSSASDEGGFGIDDISLIVHAPLGTLIIIY